MERLDKILSHLNYGSRKEVKNLIRKGFVLVNGKTIFDDDFKVDPINDEITIFNNTIEYNKYVYIMLNKPKDYISATYDPRYKTVIDLVSEYQKMGIFPVGRLDIDTEGLLILTNDGQLAHNLLSPSKHVNKTYYVEFSGEFKDSYYNDFEKGIKIDDYITEPAKVILLDKNKAHCIIHEGKFHQVKKMFQALNMEVTYLKRVKFKNLELDNSLGLGEYRMLSLEEIEDLKNEETR